MHLGACILHRKKILQIYDFLLLDFEYADACHRVSRKEQARNCLASARSSKICDVLLEFKKKMASVECSFFDMTPIMKRDLSRSVGEIQGAHIAEDKCTSNEIASICVMLCRKGQNIWKFKKDACVRQMRVH